MKFFRYIILFIIVASCGSSRNFTEKEQQSFKELQNLVAEQKFEIISYKANPTVSNAFMQVANTNILGPGNTAGSIQITGSSNFVRFKGDSIHGILPFFGEQNSGSPSMTNHNGIEFNDIPEKYNVKINEDKHSVEISFVIPDEFRSNENYNVYINLFPNRSSNLRIQSTARTSIEFAGNVKQLVEDKK